MSYFTRNEATNVTVYLLISIEESRISTVSDHPED